MALPGAWSARARVRQQCPCCTALPLVCSVDSLTLFGAAAIDRFAEAEVHYNRAIELDESHVELRLDVVRLKLVEYETLPEPAPVVLNPMAFSSKETADTLRAVPRKLRLNEEIVSHLRAAIRVQPHAAQLHHMLGDAVVNGSSLRNQRDRYMDSSAEALHLTLRQCDVVSVSMNGDRERCDCAHYDDCNSILRHLGPEVSACIPAMAPTLASVPQNARMYPQVF